MEVSTTSSDGSVRMPGEVLNPFKKCGTKQVVQKSFENVKQMLINAINLIFPDNSVPPPTLTTDASILWPVPNLTSF